MNAIRTQETPAEAVAGLRASGYPLQMHGLANLRKVYWNLSTEALVEEALYRGEGRVSKGGALVVETGGHTSRAANDKFIVRESESGDEVWWGDYNRPYPEQKFGEIHARINGFLQGRDVFVQDVYAGADPEYRVPVRIVTEQAWGSLFARNMLISPETDEEYREFVPEFTLIVVPGFEAVRSFDCTNSETFIIANFKKQLGLIGVSRYGGEIKKTIFTVMNYLLPRRNVLSMHCSANMGKNGDAALFFGLSGTGKTTLSADPARSLIGDDEHGWSEEGIFNIEDGCYAKVIRLSPTAEPEIFACTHRFGTILENVVMDSLTHEIDLDDASITENTRASYPLHFIGNSVPEKQAGHPKNIIFLTCDASGVMPPIAKLTADQALYHFISGYTSKVGGTEKGVGSDPQVTFSTCFGAPFMVHPPAVYAELLKRKIEKYGVNCWLLNTGWVGGRYGIGERISIKHTRRLLNAALNGELNDVPSEKDDVFGFSVPQVCDGIPEGVLDPAASWGDREAYDTAYCELASRFMENFKKFEADIPAEVKAAGPVKERKLVLV